VRHVGGETLDGGDMTDHAQKEKIGREKSSWSVRCCSKTVCLIAHGEIGLLQE